MTDAPALPTYALDDGVATITLDDGKANTFSSAVVAHLQALTDRVEADRADALVIVGRPGRFSAGFDLAEMTASTEGMRRLVADGARWWYRLYGLGLPTVAACTGHALAGGAITLLSCDVRVGADVPCKIGLNEAAIGLTLPVFATELARDRLATPAFSAATIAGTTYDAAGAAAVGYLDEVVPAEEVLATAYAHAARLRQVPKAAYAGTKRNARGATIDTFLPGVDADLAKFEVPPIP